jgi:molybdopterin converting factor small subunit
MKETAMNIELNLFASLAEYLPDKEKGNPNILELPAGTTIGGLIGLLRIPPEAPRIIFLNGTHAGREAVLKNGDRVGMFPPLAGG